MTRFILLALIVLIVCGCSKSNVSPTGIYRVVGTYTCSYNSFLDQAELDSASIWHHDSSSVYGTAVLKVINTSIDSIRVILVSCTIPCGFSYTDNMYYNNSSAQPITVFNNIYYFHFIPGKDSLIAGYSINASGNHGKSGVIQTETFTGKKQ